MPFCSGRSKRPVARRSWGTGRPPTPIAGHTDTWGTRPRWRGAPPNTLIFPGETPQEGAWGSSSPLKVGPVADRARAPVALLKNFLREGSHAVSRMPYDTGHTSEAEGSSPEHFDFSRADPGGRGRGSKLPAEGASWGRSGTGTGGPSEKTFSGKAPTLLPACLTTRGTRALRRQAPPSTLIFRGETPEEGAGGAAPH